MQTPRLTTFLLALILAIGGASLAACNDQGPAEEAGEEIDDAMDDAADEMEDAREEMEDLIED